jgi:hypothetical protein
METPTKAPKEAKKKLDEKPLAAKPVEDNTLEGEPKQTLPCRIPFSGMFPFKDEKVRHLSDDSVARPRGGRKSFCLSFERNWTNIEFEGF